jgi:MarR family transcriptional regulator, transcriptional regulator for hemolysin
VRPEQTPVGLGLARASRLVGRAFDEALGEAGGSLPVWLVLLNLKLRRVASQRELADAVGVTAPTLTHHLGAMEAGGLLVRCRDPHDRRNHIIELTELGEQAFVRLRDAAVTFDARLRSGFEPGELAALGAQLERLCANVADPEAGPPGGGAIVNMSSTAGLQAVGGLASYSSPARPHSG